MASTLQRLAARTLGLATLDDVRALAESLLPPKDNLTPPGFTLISGDAVAVDPATVKRIQETAQQMWLTDPLIKQAVRVKRNFVLGAGITFTAEDPEIDEALHESWRDPLEKMPDQLEDWFNSLAVTSELCLRFFETTDGMVRVRQIPFAEIDDVITDPDDRNKILFIRRKYVHREFDKGSKSWRAEQRDDLIPGDEVIFVATNRVPGTVRGISDLYAAIPWARAYSEWLRDRMAINKSKGAWAWIRKVTGGAAQLAASAAKLASDIGGKVKSAITGQDPEERKAPPKPGSVITSNGNVDWSVVSNPVNAEDAKEDGRAIKLQVCSATNVFEHYFGDASVANLASAQAMELPMLREYETMQGLLGRIVAQVFRRKLEGKVRAGRLPDAYTITREVLRDDALVEEQVEKATVDCPVDVNWPPLKSENRKDLVTAAEGEQRMGIKSNATIASELGVEDWEQERARLFKERQERQARAREDETNDYPPFPQKPGAPKKNAAKPAEDDDEDGDD